MSWSILSATSNPNKVCHWCKNCMIGRLIFLGEVIFTCLSNAKVEKCKFSLNIIDTSFVYVNFYASFSLSLTHTQVGVLVTTRVHIVLDGRGLYILIRLRYIERELKKMCMSSAFIFCIMYIIVTSVTWLKNDDWQYHFGRQLKMPYNSIAHNKNTKRVNIDKNYACPFQNHLNNVLIKV